LVWFLLILPLVVASAANAQLAPAEDYFHDGAMNYLSNNIPAALQVVTNGLQQFPDDEKLKKLYELLKQQQQQQQQNQQQQDQKQDQQKQDQQKQDQQKQDEQKKNEQKQQDQQQSKNDQQKKDEQKQPEQPKSGGDKSKGKPEDKKDRESKQVEAHAMTPQEAKQLLDAQKGDERVLVFQPQGEPKNRDKKLKDW
jgi:Ca-activated chloride channel family protein